MIRVLFVCLGNICRSPQAEGIFADLVGQAGLDQAIAADSAGTSDYHAGSLADPRTRAVSERHGLDLRHRSRQVTHADLEQFDYVVAMDRANLAILQQLAGGERRLRDKLHLLRAFDPSAESLEVPDPYAGGPDGFERVFQMCRRASEGLLQEIRTKLG